MDYALYSQQFYRKQYLMHYGVKGMHWGIRRYQNPDGTLTEEGKRRHHLGTDEANQEYLREKEKIEKRTNRNVGIAAGAGYAGMAGGVAAASVIGTGGMAAASLLAGLGAPFVGLATAVAISKISEKKIDVLKKSYGEKRIDRMETWAKNASRNLTMRDVQRRAAMAQIDPSLARNVPIYDWQHMITKGIKNGDIKLSVYDNAAEGEMKTFNLDDVIKKYGKSVFQ